MKKNFTIHDLFTPRSFSEVGPKSDPQEITRQCSICGKDVLIKVYNNEHYTGGNYFGKIPLSTDKEFKKALKAGTTKARWSKTGVEVLKKDPKPYAYAEYWECERCYRKW